MKPIIIVNIILAVLLTAAVLLIFVSALRRRRMVTRREGIITDIDRYRSLMRSTTSAVWEFDPVTDELCMIYNHGIGDDGFKIIPDFRTSLTGDGTIHPDSAEIFAAYTDRLVKGAESAACELHMLSRSGNYRWYSVSCVATDKPDGGKKYFGQIINIDANHKQLEKLQEHSEIDALTNLNTRQCVEHRANSIIAALPKQPNALFLIDVDNFRQISQSVGTLYSEAVLMELSEELKKIFPESSILGRVNTDEFVVFVPNIISERQIGQYAHEACGCMEHYFTNNEQTECVSCSVGVSRYPRDAASYEQLFYRADVALYVSKFSGRNTYHIYEDEMETNLSNLAGTAALSHDENVFKYDDPPMLRNSSLLSQTIEILFESHELASSINMILKLIGRNFGIDHCAIVEFDDGGRNARITSIWESGHANAPVLNEYNKHPESVAKMVYYQDGQEFYLCHNTSQLEDFDQRAWCVLHSMHSLLQCPIRDGSVFKGVISYSVFSDNNVFTDDVVRELLLISKIVGGYLLRLRTMQSIDHIGDFDKLTGLMSVSRFISEAERVLNDNPSRSFAILYADIDRFKFINEIYGYKAGDDILIHISELVASLQGKNELLSRVDADKFVGLFEMNSIDELYTRLKDCDSMVNSIKKTDSDCYKLPIRAGIYIVPIGESKNVSSMVDRANLARKSIKNVHQSSVVLFDESMKSRIKKQKEIEDVMHSALANHEFVVYFQPKFSLTQFQLVGAEALVRWNRPGLGLLPPDEFIPIFEDNGFIVELDFYVLEVVCKKLRNDLDRQLTVRPISVNFSRIHLNTDNFIERLHKCLRQYNIPANLIEIEITESALTDNEDYLVDVLQSLHRIGLIVSMDDFGSGYSSLNLLKKLPFDVLKIDKKFFDDSGATERERLIITSVISMAKALNIRVVSEGVENEEQAEFLRGIHCDQVQGFLFARPMDMETFESKYQSLSR